MDQEFDRVALDFLIPSIDVAFEIAARQNRTRARQKRPKDRELARSKQRRLAGERSLPRRRIEAYFSVAEYGRRAAALTPENGAHPRQQLADLEGFHQIVVRSKVEAIDAVVDAVACCHDNHRKLTAGLAEPAQDFPAIGFGQAKIEKRDVVALGLRGFDRRSAIGDPIDRIGSVLQRLLHGGSNHTIIFDEQNAHGYPVGTSAERNGPAMIASV